MKTFLSGFTLIELMIVMTIVVALSAIVGPMAITSIEKAESKQEMLTMKNWFRKISYRAFSTGQPYRLKLSGKKAELFVLGHENNPIITKSLNVLFFHPQVFDYSPKGFVTPNLVIGTYREQSFELDLNLWVNGENSVKDVSF